MEKLKPLPLEIVDHFTQLGIPVNELNSYYFRNADDYEIISNDISVETDKLLSEVKTVLGKDEQSALTLDDLKLGDSTMIGQYNAVTAKLRTFAHSNKHSFVKCGDLSWLVNC